MESCNQIIIFAVFISIIIVIYSVYSCNNELYYYNLHQQIRYHRYINNINNYIINNKNKEENNNNTNNDINDNNKEENNKNTVVEKFSNDIMLKTQDTGYPYDNMEPFQDVLSSLLASQIEKGVDHIKANNDLTNAQIDKDTAFLKLSSLKYNLQAKQDLFGQKTNQKKRQTEVIRAKDSAIINSLNDSSNKIIEADKIVKQKNAIANESKNNFLESQKLVNINKQKLDTINAQQMPTLDSIKAQIPLPK